MNGKWYIKKGEHGDVVISTRIRLARNIAKYPFPVRLDAEGRQKVFAEVREAVQADKSAGFGYIDMSALNRSQAVSLAERHLISPEFAGSNSPGALLLTEDESVSIMVCEEDHIRLQVMQAGLALQEAYARADAIDDALDARLAYAYDARLGYLTQCPTNLGTAMRASVMLHLPALTRCGQISRLAGAVSKLGLIIRGAHGEGSSPKGDLYQLSNQITLGITEKAALDNLQSITLQLVNQERDARKALLENPAESDKVWRALGILQTARLLSGDEFMELVSLVRLGCAAGMLDTPLEKVNELMISMQPATITAAQGRNLTPQQRDAVRAEQVRSALAAGR